jgi:uncharacterized protein YceK
VRNIMVSLTLAVALVGCSSLRPYSNPPTVEPSYPDRRSQSLRLNPGMTEAEVIAILGEPSSATLNTCGQALGKPWACKLWPYYGGNTGNSLKVYFGNSDGKGWKVVSWDLN